MDEPQLDISKGEQNGDDVEKKQGVTNGHSDEAPNKNNEVLSNGHKMDEEITAHKKSKKKEKKHRKKSSRSHSKSKRKGKSESSSSESSRSESRKKKKHKSRRSRSSSKSSKSSSPSQSRKRKSKRSSHKPRRRSRSRSPRRSRERNHRHRRDNRDHRDRRHRDDRDDKRDRSRDRSRNRSRTRSPHPLLRNVAPSSMRDKIVEDVNKPKQFWDGFQWLDKTNVTSNTDPAVMSQTKKMRQIQIANLPLFKNIKERDVAELVANFMVENFLNDEGNLRPVIDCTFQPASNSAIMELSSVEEANRLLKVDSLKVLTHNCKLTRHGDSLFGPSVNKQTQVANAQTTAQAQAAAMAAMNLISKKGGNTTFSLDGSEFAVSQPTLPRSILLTNLIHQDEARKKTPTEFDEMLEDTTQVFNRFGQVEQSLIVKDKMEQKIDNKDIELGAIVLVYIDSEAAEKAAYNMQGRKYDLRDIHIQSISNEVCASIFGLKVENRDPVE